jgi:hypothetical protein
MIGITLTIDSEKPENIFTVDITGHYVAIGFLERPRGHIIVMFDNLKEKLRWQRLKKWGRGKRGSKEL